MHLICYKKFSIINNNNNNLYLPYVFSQVGFYVFGLEERNINDENRKEIISEKKCKK